MSETTTTPVWLTMANVAKRLGLSAETVRKMPNRPPFVRFGRQWRIRVVDLEEWEDERAAAAKSAERDHEAREAEAKAAAQEPEWFQEEISGRRS